MRVNCFVRMSVAFTGLLLQLSVPLVHGHGGDPGMVHACVNNSSGGVKFVGVNDSCQTNETAVDWDKPSRTVPGTFDVLCNAGQTIGLAVGSLIPGDTLRVSGTCNENVVILEDLDRVTQDGQGTATINGLGPIQDTISIRGRGITITGFTINSGNRGIAVVRGGTATIDGNLIQNAAGSHGILVSGGTATIGNNTIQNNAVHGIQINLSGSANIGFRTPQDASVKAPTLSRVTGTSASTCLTALPRESTETPSPAT